MERKLATILAADVVGYSRLMGEDEEATLQKFQACQEVIEALVAKHSGRVFSGAGDSVFAEFASPVEAARCAVEFQQQIEQRDSDLPEDRRMRFRIGINLGDIIVEDGNLFGDGVNVAARLETMAPPGGICISESVYHQIRNKVPFGYECLGEHSAKNIAEPVIVYHLIPTADAAGKTIIPVAVRMRRWRWVTVAALTILMIVAGSIALRFELWDWATKNNSAERPVFPGMARPTRHFRVERPAKLTGADALTIYDRIRQEMVVTYSKSAIPYAKVYHTWRRYNATPYLSATHGRLYVNNYANPTAKAYGKFERAGTLPVGSVLAKDSFEVTESGDVVSGPLTLMEKMPAGFNPENRDWRYTMIMPDGGLFGITKGERSQQVDFCVECHIAAGDAHDHLFFIPDRYRIKLLNPERTKE
ncbi:MAG: adenylate/guanylate cyclase domain-containing protein [Methyloligellaceae bacterium]